MKQIFLIIAAALFSLVGCSSDNKDELDGLGDDMKISSDNVVLETSKENGIYINVPKEGATFYLQVDNYEVWWVSSVSEKVSQNGDFKLSYQAGRDKNVYKKGWYSVEVLANKAKCVIDENTSTESRTAKMEMSVGNVFKPIYIIQPAQ